MNEEKMASPSAVGTQRERRRLRNIFIDKPLQREFVFVVTCLMMVCMGGIAFVIYRTIHQAAGGGGFHFGKISPYEVLSEVSYQLLVRVTLILLVTLMVLVTFGIFFLHRVAGPVHRFRLVFFKINEGQLPGPIKLREGDFFPQAVDEINVLVKKLQAQQDAIKEIRQKTEQILMAHPSEGIAKTTGEIKRLLEQLTLGR